MKMTDNIYLTDNSGIYVEFFGKNGSYTYLHIDCNGMCKFEKEINNASLNTYWIDYVSSKVIQERIKIKEWADSLCNDSDISFPPKADDIPF